MSPTASRRRATSSSVCFSPLIITGFIVCLGLMGVFLWVRTARHDETTPVTRGQIVYIASTDHEAGHEVSRPATATATPSAPLLPLANGVANGSHPSSPAAPPKPLDMAQAELWQHFKTALGRPLCMVLVLGSDVQLDQAPTNMAHEHKNCLFHIPFSAAGTVTVTSWPPPPPFQFMFDPFVLVADEVDLVTDRANSVPASRVLRIVNDTTTGTMSSAMPLPPMAERVHVHASVYADVFEPNRIAGLIVRLRNEADYAVVRAILTRHTPTSNAAYIEVVVLQNCSHALSSSPPTNEQGNVTEPSNEADLANRFVHWIINTTHGFGELLGDRTGAPFNDTTTCRHRIFVRSSSPKDYPIEPMMFVGIDQYGRFSNRFIEEAFLFLDIANITRSQPKHTTVSRTYIAFENIYGDNSVVFMYNASLLAQHLGRPNRVLGMSEAVSLRTLKWCGVERHTANATDVCYQLDTINDCRQNSKYVCNDHRLDNDAVPIQLSCEQYLPVGGLRFHRWAGSMDAYLNESEPCRPKRTAVLDNSGQVGTFASARMLFHKLAFERNGGFFYPTREHAIQFQWMQFSSLVSDLADRQMQILHRRLRSYWNLSHDDDQLRILGLHLRFDDYSGVTTGDAWTKAIMEVERYLAMNATLGGGHNNKTEPLHGIIYCSDNPWDKKFAIAAAMFPNVPKHFCLSDLPLSTSMVPSGIQIAVTQTLLSRTTCFLGVLRSTFTWHIEVMRMQNGYAQLAPCDQQLPKRGSSSSSSSSSSLL